MSTTTNTIKKTNRKNKTNLVVNWLKGFFTIDQLKAANPNFVMITLRSRLNSAKKDNIVSEIGCMHNQKGRPKLVFATAPVSSEVLDAARQAGVIFNEHYDSIAVVNVDAVQIPSNVETEAAAAAAESTTIDISSPEKVNA